MLGRWTPCYHLSLCRTHVYSKVKELLPTHACKEMRDNFELCEKECGYSETSIPQLEDVSNFLKRKHFSFFPVFFKDVGASSQVKRTKMYFSRKVTDRMFLNFHMISLLYCWHIIFAHSLKFYEIIFFPKIVTLKYFFKIDHKNVTDFAFCFC